jgi:hypothetical protein
VSLFYDRLDEIIGATDSQSEIRAMVRQCWFFDFDGYPLRVWIGQGKLHTSDSNTWLGSMNGNGQSLLQPPRISDGRDGTAPTYDFKILLVDTPGARAQEMYDAIKAEQWRVNERPLTGYHALFQVGEGLRPNTPLEFFKELTMQSVLFDESLDMEGTSIVRRYSVTVIAKDGNAGRSNVPGGTYSPSVQRARARQLGLDYDDKGCDFVASLSDRTYQIP